MNIFNVLLIWMILGALIFSYIMFIYKPTNSELESQIAELKDSMNNGPITFIIVAIIASLLFPIILPSFFIKEDKNE